MIRILTADDVKEYKSKTPPFGPLGWVTYKRTYARPVEGESRTENWWETCLRVLNGNYALEIDRANELGQWTKDYRSTLKEEALKAYDLMFNLKWLPPGRGLWASGVPVSQLNGATLTNCWYVDVEPRHDKCSYPFCFAMDMLMLGGGVGFGVRKQTISKFPTVKNGVNLYIVCREDHRDYQFLDIDKIPLDTHQYVVLHDSREGWVYGLKKVIDTAFLSKRGHKKNLVIDISNIRPSGEPIKGFGGISSGPFPLVEMLRGVNKLLNKRAELQLTDVDCVDIMTMIGRCVVSGGVRRSAMLALGDSESEEFKLLKNPKLDDEYHNWAIQNHRWASNNSIALTRNSNVAWTEFSETVFVKGEPGFFNEVLVQQYGRTGEELEDKATGTNPCLIPGTLIQTRQGVFPIQDLIGKTVDVWNGEEWKTVNQFKVTGQNKKVYTVELHSGQTITATAEHEFDLENGDRKKLKNLNIGDKLKTHDIELDFSHTEPGAYLKGFLLGDGTSNDVTPILFVYDPKKCCLNRLQKSFEELIPEDHIAPKKASTTFMVIPDGNRDRIKGITSCKDQLMPWVTSNRQRVFYEVLNWSKASRCQFIAGYFDADGSIMDTKNGFGYQVSSVNKAILEAIQLILQSLGVKSCLRLNKPGGEKDFGPDRGGICQIQPLYRLTVSQGAAIKLSKLVKFERLVSFAKRETKYKLKDNSSKVVSIQYSHISPKVYCCETNDPKSMSLANGVVIGRCGEISLESYEPCNLSEVFPSNCADSDELTSAIKMAYKYAKRVTLSKYHWPESVEVVQRNRRIGVSLSGIQDWKLKWGLSGTEFRDYLDTLYLMLRAKDKQFSKKLGISESIKITTVKPSGTISLLAGVSPGIHYPYSAYYIRRIQFQDGDPILGYLAECGLPFHKAAQTPNAVVVEFPIKVPTSDNPLFSSAGEVSVRTQLSNQADLQHYWADNQVSCTISIREEDRDALPGLIAEFKHELKSTSFLPYSPDLKEHYVDLPYEPITKEKYEELMAQIKQWPNPQSFLEKDYTVDIEECVGGACPVK